MVVWGKRSNNRGQSCYKSFEEPRIIIPKGRFTTTVCFLAQVVRFDIHSFGFRAMRYVATAPSTKYVSGPEWQLSPAV